MYRFFLHLVEPLWFYTFTNYLLGNLFIDRISLFPPYFLVEDEGLRNWCHCISGFAGVVCLHYVWEFFNLLGAGDLSILAHIATVNKSLLLSCQTQDYLRLMHTAWSPRTRWKRCFEMELLSRTLEGTEYGYDCVQVALCPVVIGRSYALLLAGEISTLIHWLLMFVLQVITSSFS